MIVFFKKFTVESSTHGLQMATNVIPFWAVLHKLISEKKIS